MIRALLPNTLLHFNRARGFTPCSLFLKAIKPYTLYPSSIPISFFPKILSANFSTTITIKPKRVRKPKLNIDTEPPSQILEDIKTEEESVIETKPKRVRKPKVNTQIESIFQNAEKIENASEGGVVTTTTTTTTTTTIKPKRVRKPKLNIDTEPPSQILKEETNIKTETAIETKPKRVRKSSKTNTQIEHTPQAVIDTITGSIFNNLESLNTTTFTSENITNEPLLTAHNEEKNNHELVDDYMGIPSMTDNIANELPPSTTESDVFVRDVGSLSMDVDANPESTQTQQIQDEDEQPLIQIENFKYCPKPDVIVALCDDLGVTDVSNIRLFSEALTVSTKYSPIGSKDISRLTYLGESALDFFVFEILQKELPTFKYLQKVILTPAVLFDLSMAMGIGRNVWIELPHYLSSNRVKIVSEALKSFVGAVYLEYGEETTRRFVHENILFRTNETLLKNYYYIYFNHKGLQVALDRLKLEPTIFQLKEPLKLGNDNELIFTVNLYQQDKVVATGEGSRLGDAIYNARDSYLQILTKKGIVQ